MQQLLIDTLEVTNGEEAGQRVSGEVDSPSIRQDPLADRCVSFGFRIAITPHRSTLQCQLGMDQRRGIAILDHRRIRHRRIPGSRRCPIVDRTLSEARRCGTRSSARTCAALRH